MQRSHNWWWSRLESGGPEGLQVRVLHAAPQDRFFVVHLKSYLSYSAMFKAGRWYYRQGECPAHGRTPISQKGEEQCQ